MFCMNCGQELPEGAKFCKRCGTPQGAVSPDGTYKPEKEDADSASTKDAPKLGSFSIDGDDTGEVLPQRSSDSANLFSLASKPNPNAAAPVEKSGPSPFKPAEEKKSDDNSSIFRPLGSANIAEAPKAAAAPSPFRPNASAPAKKEEEAPKAAPAPASAPINSAFKPATPAASAKKEEAPKTTAAVASGAFKPATPAAKEEAPKSSFPSAFKSTSAPAKKEEAPKATPAATPASTPINSAFKPAASAAPKKEEAPKAAPAPSAAPASTPINSAFKAAGSDNKKEETGFKPLGAKSELPKQPQPSNPFKSFGLTKADAESNSSGSGLGAYRPMGEEDSESTSLHHEEPKLGSFSVDAEDTGEVLPQRSESERSTLFSLAGKANPDAGKPAAPSGPSPFRQAEKPNAFAAPSNNAFASSGNNTFAAPNNNQGNSPFAAPANNSPFAAAPSAPANNNQPSQSNAFAAPANNAFAAPANNSPFAAAPSPFKPATGGLGSANNAETNTAEEQPKQQNAFGSNNAFGGTAAGFAPAASANNQPKSNSPFKATADDFADIVGDEEPAQKNNPFGMMGAFGNNNANANNGPTTFKNTLFKEPEPEPEIDPTAVARPKASPYSPVYRKPSQEKAEAEAAEAAKKAAAEAKTEEPKKKVNLAPQQGNPFVPIDLSEEDIDNFPLSSVSPFKPLS